MNLTDEVKWVMYDLYTKDKNGGVRLNYNDFFGLEFSDTPILTDMRNYYYKRSNIMLRKKKILQIKNKLDGQQHTHR